MLPQTCTLVLAESVSHVSFQKGTRLSSLAFQRAILQSISYYVSQMREFTSSITHMLPDKIHTHIHT